MRSSRSAGSCQSRAARSPHGPAERKRALPSSSQVVADRTVSDAIVKSVVRDAAWTIDEHGPMAGVRRLTPGGPTGGAR